VGQAIPNSKKLPRMLLPSNVPVKVGPMIQRGHIGKTLRALRLLEKYSQLSLAEKIGWKGPALSRLEKATEWGRQQIGSVMAVLEALGYDFADFQRALDIVAKYPELGESGILTKLKVELGTPDARLEMRIRQEAKRQVGIALAERAQQEPIESFAAQVPPGPEAWQHFNEARRWIQDDDLSERVRDIERRLKVLESRETKKQEK